MPDLKQTQDKREQRRGIFPADSFIYDDETDTYKCPAGKLLRPKTLHKHRQSRDYAASKKDCAKCELRPQCTKNKSGRSIKRHLRQDELDYMRALARSSMAKRDIKTRQHLMERSFARAEPYGLSRARWRGLRRVQIQEYMTAAIQNIQVLVRYGGQPTKRVAVRVISVSERLDSLRISMLIKLELLLIAIFKPGIAAKSYD